MCEQQHTRDCPQPIDLELSQVKGLHRQLNAAWEYLALDSEKSQKHGLDIKGGHNGSALVGEGNGI